MYLARTLCLFSLFYSFSSTTTTTMASDGPTHFLSLKVMRVSRPELAPAWQPFYSSSPSFSAHSSAHLLSLQGAAPLPGHPKTLRDLTHASELLTLPSAFGSIQLGETFSSCLCVNNEAQMGIEVVQVKVEMQTITAKVTLSELDVDEAGSAGKVLSAGDTLESVVHHEIKELGQHVLACTVSYRLPQGARPIPGASEDANDPSLVTFRKFYKFAVTNPLSVKTKVHAPKSPTAQLSLAERDKVFLEVHIQNVTQEPMHFERMQLEPMEDWTVQDANHKGDTSKTSIFSGSLAIMQPQDTRQYLYILTPKKTTAVPPALTPGSIIPLGRLDISWRSSFGEPGRLLTSMLTRRIPFPSAPAPASAIPPYLKRAGPGGSNSRPQSPSISSRPLSPPPAQRPGSPFQVARSNSISQGAYPQSPQLPPLSAVPSAAPQSDLDVNLIVEHLHDAVKLEKPFTVSLQLVVSSNMPLRDFAMRKLSFAVQHLQAPKVTPLTIAQAVTAAVAPPSEALSPRMSSSGFSTPSSATAAANFNYALAHQKILDVSLRPSSPTGTIHGHSPNDVAQPIDPNVPILPPPFFDGHEEKPLLNHVLFVGSSTIFLPSVQITTGDQGTPSNPITQDFELTYLPMKGGFCRVGGLRVLLVQDKGTSDFQEFEVDSLQASQMKAQTLKEYDIIAETWVST
ncbi:hypothetical protein D9611_004478 [Ephemerocybe angulata]|uniref:DUF974-domain-containing protein n=1 Tax=Ephemerocybe angulata TaxID=980116 RepID=A0A8H5BL86_9AGAR|nr:hypothetical protein D9611_004478 [Tulosesus angulatus]